jgi:hypothetical protein
LPLANRHLKIIHSRPENSPMTDLLNAQTPQRVRRVLVVAYVFPPSGGAGVQRVTKFVKYLPEFGWECSVLTVANPSVPLQDDSLLKEIREDTVVRRARTYEPSYALKNVVSASSGATSGSAKRSGLKQRIKGLIRSVGNAVLQPDAQVLWYPQAVREGRRLLSELHHDAIFVTAPPFSAFLIGAALSKCSGLPLIVDYRDEWGISNRYQENRQKSDVSHWLQSRMQRRVLRQAKSVIATTRRSADSLRELVQSSGSSADVSHIYNGFDADDVAPAAITQASCPQAQSMQAACTPSSCTQSVGTQSSSGDSQRFRIAYVGTLWNLTSIEPLVRAMEQVCDTEPELAARLELVVAGRRTADQDVLLDRLQNRPCRVIRENYVPHSRAIEIMRSADAQCLLLSGVEEASRVMPAKTFEYLALERPILSIVPAGEVSELLDGCPFANTFSPTDVTGISNYLIRGALGAVSDPLPSVATGWDVARFERRELTRQLASVMSSACSFATPIDVVGPVCEAAK